MNNAKQLRGQLRQVVKEMLPETLTEQHYETLKKHIDARINEIEKSVKDTMHTINERHKDTMSYLLREVTLPKTTEPTEQK
jgi:hypothetical protein